MQLATAEQMRELDRRTIDEVGIPGMVLMENAGKGTVVSMEECFGPVQEKAVLVFVGPGNNGGDGLVIARTVHGLGGLAYIYYLVDPEKLSGDAGLNYRIIQQLNIPSMVLDTAETLPDGHDAIRATCARHPVHSIVDAIFGTGLIRELSGHYLETVHFINKLHQEGNIKVIAADLPSGLETDSGNILGSAVEADLTVTYGLPKPAHFHHGGFNIGQLSLIDIGIPPEIQNTSQLEGSCLDKSITAFLQRKTIASHKGSNGHLLILAGSLGKTGAAILSGQGALHSGAGLVTFAVPNGLNTVFETALLEAMSFPLPHSDTSLSNDDYDLIKTVSVGKNAMVIGPGIGTEKQTEQLVLRLYSENTLPQVLDADAINILSKHPEIIGNPAGPRIFTPHPGEMARLLATSTTVIQSNRTKAAGWLESSSNKTKYPLVTVLKGAGTVVANSSGQWAINTTGNPGMGAAGMGDVLSGIIGSLLVQGYSVWDAARLGVYLHGLAADIIAHSTPYGFTASQVAANLPAAIGQSINNDIPAKEKLC